MKSSWSFISKPSFLEKTKKVAAVTAKLANEIKIALSRSAVRKVIRKTGIAILNFTDKKKENTKSESYNHALGNAIVRKNTMAVG